MEYGIITPDGKSITLRNRGNGFFTGKFNDGEIELIVKNNKTVIHIMLYSPDLPNEYEKTLPYSNMKEGLMEIERGLNSLYIKRDNRKKRTITSRTNDFGMEWNLR